MRLEKYDDPGHGWVKVPVSLLVKWSIEKKITPCSYRRGDFAYLEEDCDATLFVETARSRGVSLNIVDHISDNQSRIRTYESYRPPHTCRYCTAEIPEDQVVCDGHEELWLNA